LIQGASDEEKAMAKTLTALVSPDRDVQEIAEGAEPDSFWNGLGGKGDYDTQVGLPDVPLLEPRLFHCVITSTGKIIICRPFHICTFKSRRCTIDTVQLTFLFTV
jgi:hypothetical protein